MKLNPYIHFNGQAAAAIQFYAETLNGEVKMLMHYSDAPPDAMQQPADPQLVMHSQIEFGDNILMISDAPGCDMPSGSGNTTLSINLKNDKGEAERLFTALTADGKIIMPLANTFWARILACVLTNSARIG